jgi:hypothetical protein
MMWLKKAHGSFIIMDGEILMMSLNMAVRVNCSFEVYFLL